LKRKQKLNSKTCWNWRRSFKWKQTQPKEDNIKKKSDTALVE